MTLEHMNIKFIIGKAGCSKTTTLINIQKNIPKNKTSVAIAFTHSACKNMIMNGMQHVKTIHSFFGIMPNTTVVKIKYLPNFLLIDEFSLIPVDLLVSIFEHINMTKKEITIVLAGDLLQLPPVTTTNLIDITKIDLTGECSLKDAQQIFNTLGRTIYSTDYYKNASKLILKKNFRCGSNVMNILENVLSTSVIQLTELSKIEFDKETIFIASTYKNLKKMYQVVLTDRPADCAPAQIIKTRIGFINIHDHENFILTENLNEDFHNGDLIKIISHEPENILGDVLKISHSDPTEAAAQLTQTYLKKNEFGRFEILPSNFLTVHYSQGRGFKKIVLCVDDMFEIGMLYTAITRAREEIYFISFIDENEKNVSDIVRRFKILEKNIYG